MKKFLLIFMLFVSPAFGQDSRPIGDVPPVEQDLEQDEEVVQEAETNEGWIKLRVGVDFTTHYFNRGVMQENQGVITQPWAVGELHLYKDPGNWVSDVYLFAGVWNSFHDGPTGSSSKGKDNPHTWYENRVTVGAGIEIKDVFVFSGGYNLSSSPNGSFDVVEEVFFRGDLKDKTLWDLKGDGWEFDGIRPHGIFAWETFGQRDVGTKRGSYAEIGIRPGLTIKDLFTGDGEPSGWDLKISVPFLVGFSVNEYYEVQGKGDTAFGFMDLGLDGELPLACINPRYGHWSLYAAGHWIHLDQNSARFNKGHKNEIIGSGGIRFSY